MKHAKSRHAADLFEGAARLHQLGNCHHVNRLAARIQIADRVENQPVIVQIEIIRR